MFLVEQWTALMLPSLVPRPERVLIKTVFNTYGPGNEATMLPCKCSNIQLCDRQHISGAQDLLLGPAHHNLTIPISVYM